MLESLFDDNEFNEFEDLTVVKVANGAAEYSSQDGRN